MPENSNAPNIHAVGAAALRPQPPSRTLRRIPSRSHPCIPATRSPAIRFNLPRTSLPKPPPVVTPTQSSGLFGAAISEVSSNRSGSLDDTAIIRSFTSLSTPIPAAFARPRRALLPLSQRSCFAKSVLSSLPIIQQPGIPTPLPASIHHKSPAFTASSHRLSASIKLLDGSQFIW